MGVVRCSTWIFSLAWIALLDAGPRAVAEDGTVSVRGKISVDGKLLEGGKIFFFVGEDQFVGAKVTDGSYKVDRVPVGTHIVAIEFKDVPARYSDKSELRVDVRTGTNVFNFDLKSK